MSDRFYPIHNLEDVLSKFRAELNIAIEEVNRRITALETQLSQTIPPTQDTGTPEDMEELERKTRDSAVSTIVMVAQARRAVYGYAMLLDSLGLPKDAREQVRHFEQLISAILRLQQTIAITEMALTALETGHPYLALFRFAVAGGTAAATLIYSSRATGG